MTTGKTGAPSTMGIAGSSGPSGGILIHRVDKGGLAAHAGIVVGDELLSIDGKPCRDQQSVGAILAAAGAGVTVTVIVLRRNQRTQIPVLLRERKKVMSLDFDETDAVLEKKIAP